jgi:hypothetical protein
VNVGAENKNKVIAAAVLGIIAVVALAYEVSGWFGSSSASTTVPAPASVAVNVSPRPRNSAGNRNTPSKKDPTQTLDPSLRFDVLKTSEDTKYEGTGRNIFRVFVEPPPRPVASVVTQQPQVAQGPPPPAPPPPIELKFYGFATPAGGTKRIFLAHNEDVFIAKEGDIVDRRYKVMKISANSVDILDVLSNNRQSIPLTQG